MGNAARAMRRPGRVLLLTTSMARGGAEQQVVDLAIGLRANGWAVTVLSMTAPTDHVEELRAARVSLASLEMRRARPRPGDLVRYAAHVRRWRPDVVHSHMVHANLLARVGRLLVPGVPVVCTVHSVVQGGRWREIAYRVTDPLASVTTAVSDAVAVRSQQVGAVPRGRIRTIPNGVVLTRAVTAESVRADARRALGMREAFIWVTVGRLVPEKGHDMLLRAFVAVHASRPEARLVIAGAGPLGRALGALAVELGLRDAVTFLGERRDVPSILAAADAFVLSSRWEGLPMALLEAAAQRLPIVCTDVGGCREIARPALGAVLVDTDPRSLAAGMLAVMRMGVADRAAIGERLGALVSSEFDMDAVVRRWEALYSAIRLGGRRG